MATMILSNKRQVVLPAELCRQAAIAPGARVEVERAPDGNGILVRPTSAVGKQPASALFGRHIHKGKPVAIEELQGLAAAKKLFKGGKP